MTQILEPRQLLSAVTGVPDSYETNHDVVKNDNVLLNDEFMYDAEEYGSPSASLSLQPGDLAHGSLVFNSDGSFEYTPEADWAGVETFHYVAALGTTTSSVTEVTITVVNTLSVGNVYRTITDLDILDFDTTELLENTYDNEFDPFHVTSVGTPTAGTLDYDEDNEFYSFIPDEGFNGIVQIPFEVTDGIVTKPGVLEVTVNAVATTWKITAPAGTGTVLDPTSIVIKGTGPANGKGMLKVERPAGAGGRWQNLFEDVEVTCDGDGKWEYPISQEHRLAFETWVESTSETVPMTVNGQVLQVKKSALTISVTDVMNPMVKSKKKKQAYAYTQS